MCCGKQMEKIEAGVVEASAEKHIPEINVRGNDVEVKVGAVEHPSTDEHFIEWVSLETKQGNQRKLIGKGKPNSVIFRIADGDKVLRAYAYCNLHGLWEKEI